MPIECISLRLRERHNKTLKYDATTGQKLFVPKILRGPKLPRERFDDMLNRKTAGKKAQQLETIDEATKQQKRDYTKSSDKATVQNARRRIYKRIFDTLDADKDGFISPLTIDTSSTCYRVAN